MATVCDVIFISLIIVSAVDGSKKKGYAIDKNVFKCEDLDVLKNVRWWYNWDSDFGDIETLSGCTINDRYLAPFVPMIWGYSENYKADSYIVDDRNEFVLGFNEPNHVKQAYLSAQEAADNWYLIEEAAKGRKLIVSPAAAPCTSGPDNCIDDTIDWFNDFFRILCNLSNSEPVVPCRVDFLATHHYSCVADDTMAFLEKLYNTYKLKIWLTEFACPGPEYIEEKLEYMEEILPLLENADYIYRYAWFVHRRSKPNQFINELSNLFEKETSTLTWLGDVYNEFAADDGSTSRGVCKIGRK